MKINFFLKFINGFILFSLSFTIVNSQVNPNATPEAKALLKVFYSLTDKYILTGQHNYPATKDRNSRFATEYTGHIPVIWSSDMGFARDGDKDSYHSRPDIVKEAIRQHRKGSIITLCWHAVPPTADEPVTFQPKGPYSPDSLPSIQGQLPDYQFKEVLTPGTALNKKWTAQVDTIAFYLKQLQNAGVPVLWRPYHEMNGNWFWWGGRVGEYSTIDLYKQLFDRLVNYHKLNNLVWVWNVDRPSLPVRKFSNFYPGDNYLDIASLDVYGSDFNQAYYDSLLVLAKGKPILFGEVGNPPTNEIINKQTKWTAWVIWAGMTRNTTKNQYSKLLNNPRVLTVDKPAYYKIIAPYRKVCGLPSLPLKSKYTVDFSGKWIFSEEKSSYGANGLENEATVLNIYHDDDLLSVQKLIFSEWGDHKYLIEDIIIDGSEMKSINSDYQLLSTAKIDQNAKSISINSLNRYSRNGQSFEIKRSEVWSLSESGNVLKIVKTFPGYNQEENRISLVYEKK